MAKPPRRHFPPAPGNPPGASAGRARAGHLPGSNKTPPADRGWDPVAAWYDKLVGESGSDYHRHLILPAALRLLGDVRGRAVIDICCGQGVLARPVLDLGAASFCGVDASPRLIRAAEERHGKSPGITFRVADVCRPGAWADGGFDAATCLMAVHDVPDTDAMFANMALALKPGGRAVCVFMHPCFRIPRKSHWGWDGDQKIQFRRLDSYGSPLQIPITTHPGKKSGEETVFYHRPLADLITSLGRAGLAVTACEELFSHRRSQGSGPFSKAEHKAAEEFPLFIALGCVRVGHL